MSGKFKTTTVIRFSKILLVVFFGFYVLVVAIGNVTDYRSNFQFVEAVLSMENTFQSENLMWRAVESDNLHHAAYILIILVQWSIAIMCLAGSYLMSVKLNAGQIEFHESKKWGIAGLLLGLTLWFLGFQVIGGEWFAMWQSETWNALDSAFRITAFILGTLIYLTMKND